MNYLNSVIFDKMPLLSPQNNTINNDYAEVGKEYKKQEIVAYKPSEREFSWTYFGDFVYLREIRAFFYENFGRYGSFWLPSFKSDILFLGYDQNNPNQFTAVSANRIYGTHNIKRHIFMPSLNYAAKITFIQDNQNGAETIASSLPLPQNITDKTEIMYLFFVRFNQDEITLKKRGALYESVLSFKEIQQESN